jgi:hypothetical protein
LSAPQKSPTEEESGDSDPQEKPVVSIATSEDDLFKQFYREAHPPSETLESTPLASKQSEALKPGNDLWHESLTKITESKSETPSEAESTSNLD